MKYYFFFALNSDLFIFFSSGNHLHDYCCKSNEYFLLTRIIKKYFTVKWKLRTHTHTALKDAVVTEKTFQKCGKCF